MGEGGVKATVVGGVSNFMSPGLGIVRSWQGIVEVVIRTVSIVLSFILIAAGGSCQSSANEIPSGGVTEQGLTGSAGGWLMFIGFLVVIYEIIFIVQRFVNINIVNQHITIVLIVDVIVSFVVAVLIFCGSVAVAAYVPRWVLYLENNDALFHNVLRRIITASEAAAVFGFITMLTLIALGVFVLIGGLILKWQPTTAKYK